MRNPLHKYLIRTYLEYSNNFLTTEKMAEYYSIDRDFLCTLIDKGRGLERDLTSEERDEFYSELSGDEYLI